MYTTSNHRAGTQFEAWAPQDRGQSAPLLLAVVALIALIAIALGEAGVTLIDHQRARTAADAAALAGAIGGIDDAARIAAANGATLVSFAQEGEVVVVRVSVGDVSAAARATAGPGTP